MTQAPSVAEVITARHPRGPRCEICRQHSTPTDTRTHVHALADQQPPVQLAAIQTLSKHMLDPLSMKLALPRSTMKPSPNPTAKPLRKPASEAGTIG
jgi:hypothetical protein